MTNLATSVRDTRTDHPGRPAVREGDYVLTYAELERAAGQLASFIRGHGVRPGDRVGVMLPNVAAFPVVYYGLLRAGAVVVPINPLLKGREVTHYLSDSGARMIFAWHEADGAVEGAQAAGAQHVVVDPAGSA